MTTRENPLFVWLENCPVTHGLNVITWSHAYAFLPYPFFILHRSYLLEEAIRNSRQELAHILNWERVMPDVKIEPIDIRDAQNKDGERGYTPQLVKQDPPSRVNYGARRVGDKYTWTIPLRTENIKMPSRSDFPTTYASFRILPIKDPGPLVVANQLPAVDEYSPAFYKVFAELLIAPCLRQQYIVDPMCAENDAHNLPRKRYEDLSYMQLERLPDDEKPPGWAANQILDLRYSMEDYVGYEVPASWRYYDDEVEGILRARWDEPSAHR
jgi:hypothetical protein